MVIYYYNTDSLSDAFEMASKDARTWSFPEMEALSELAVSARHGLLNGTRMGQHTIYSFTGGQFVVIVDPNKGYGIALLTLTGHEFGIDDPAGAEILAYHRDRPEVELYADQLIVFSENIQDINQLDAGYELLLRAKFIVRTDSTVLVTVGDATAERPKYRLRRRMELI